MRYPGRGVVGWSFCRGSSVQGLSSRQGIWGCRALEDEHGGGMLYSQSNFSR